MTDRTIERWRRAVLLIWLLVAGSSAWAATGSISLQVDYATQDCALDRIEASVVLQTDDTYHWDVINWVGTRAHVQYHLDGAYAGTVFEITCGAFTNRCADGFPLGETLAFLSWTGFPGLTPGSHTVAFKLMDVWGEQISYAQTLRIGDEIFSVDMTVCMDENGRQSVGPCGSTCAPHLPDDGYNGDESTCPPQPDKVGNPVTVFTGNNFEHEADIGLASPMAGGFVFTRVVQQPLGPDRSIGPRVDPRVQPGSDADLRTPGPNLSEDRGRDRPGRVF